MMYQYLSSAQTPRTQASQSAGISTSTSQILSKSPRAQPQLQFGLSQSQSLLKELELRSQRIAKLESRVHELEQLNAEREDQLLAQKAAQAERQGDQLELRQEVTALLVDKSRMLQQIEKLGHDVAELQLIVQQYPQIKQLEHLLHLLANYLVSKKQGKGEEAVLSETDLALLQLLFGDSAHFQKLKTKYREKAKRLLKDLRYEQENFLALYKFSSHLVAKALHLRELLFLGKPPEQLREFVKRHFGLVEQELENVKLKIMLREERRKRSPLSTRSKQK